MMSYSEENGQVVLTMSREQYDVLMIYLGALCACAMGGEVNIELEGIIRFVNRLNQGNPDYTPYEVGK